MVGELVHTRKKMNFMLTWLLRPKMYASQNEFFKDQESFDMSKPLSPHLVGRMQIPHVGGSMLCCQLYDGGSLTHNIQMMGPYEVS